MTSRQTFTIITLITLSIITGSIAYAWNTSPGTVCVVDDDTAGASTIERKDDFTRNPDAFDPAYLICPITTIRDQYWDNTSSAYDKRFSPADSASSNDVYVTVDDQSTSDDVDCQILQHRYIGST